MKAFKKSIAILMFVGMPALAGPSYTLDSFLGGGSLNSEDGKLSFSEFVYTPSSHAPAATDISVMALSNGLAFATPVFTISNVHEFNIAYKVTGINTYINGVTMQSTGSGTGTGFAGIFKVAEDGQNVGLANLTNAFGATTTIGTASATFDPQAMILIRDDIFAIPGDQGTAGISDFRQTYRTTGSPNPVPSPTAAIAGLALIGVIGLRRRRQEPTDN